MASDFLKGLGFWARGWKTILMNRSLLYVALMPLLISFSASVASLWIIVVYFPVWLQSLVTNWLAGLTGFWFQVLYYPMLFGGGILLFIAILYFIYVLHAVIAVPFYALLAERALTLQSPHLNRPFVFGVWVRESLAMLRVSLIKAIIFLALGVLIFIFSFVPVLNILAIVVALLLLAFDCTDYALECLRLTWRQRLAYMFRYKAMWFGQAAGLGLTLLLPGFTLLVIPGAIVGAAGIVRVPNEPRASTS